MEVSLTEAARLLNKSDRQVRYLIKGGRIPARKVDGRWAIRRADLPLSDGQRKAASQKQERAARLAMEVLQPDGEPKSPKRFSVRDLRAFREGVPLYRELISGAGVDHPAAALLREALMLLACGFHEFESRNKAAFYARAREHASRAATTLLLEDEEGRRDLVERLETALLPAIGGLIHHAERRERRK